MPSAFVQVKNNDSNNSTSTTYAVTMASAYGAGNAAAVFAHQGDTTIAFPTCTDDKSNTYLEQTACRITDLDNSNRTTGFAAVGLGGSGAPTVTLTWGTAVPWRAIIVAEYSGIASVVGGISQHQVAIGPGNDLILSGNLNFASQPGLLVGLSWEDSAGTFQPVGGTGFNDRTLTMFSGLQAYELEDRRVTVTGNAQASFTNGSGVSENYNTMAIGFLESVASAFVGSLPLLGAG